MPSGGSERVSIGVGLFLKKINVSGALLLKIKKKNNKKIKYI